MKPTVNKEFDAAFDKPEDPAPVEPPDVEEVSDPLVYKGDMTPEEFREMQGRAEADGFYERAEKPEEAPDKPCMTAKALAKLLLEMAEPDARIIIAESGETVKSCTIRMEYDAQGELVLQEFVLYEV